MWTEVNLKCNRMSLVLDHEFYKVAMDFPGVRQVDPQILWQLLWQIHALNNKIDTWKLTSICLTLKSLMAIQKLPCEQLVSPTPNKKETTVSNCLPFHWACASSSRPMWCIWCQFHLFPGGACTVQCQSKECKIYRQKCRQKMLQTFIEVFSRLRSNSKT